MKGVYCLIIEVGRKCQISIGQKGCIEFDEGCYIYVGSALNSLEPRIKRHLRKEKKLHWHVDYLLQNENSKIVDVKVGLTTQPLECALSQKMAGDGRGISDFGCSDCNCASHLFYFINCAMATRSCQRAFHQLGLDVKNLSYLEISTPL